MAVIVKVKNKKGLRQFINFPHQLYMDQPNYISELNMTLKNRLSYRNPFLKHSEIALYLAKESEKGKTLGRIAAIYNKTHLEKHNDSCGFFGFFDCIDDEEVAKLLVNQASNWLRLKGLKYLVGPTNLTMNESCGILCKGYEFPNQINMPYNYPYYNDLLEACGLINAIDLLAYEIIDRPTLEKYSNIMQRAEKRLYMQDIQIRATSPKTYTKDINSLRSAYNKFNEGNWGFMPLNKLEFEYLASDLKSIMPYDLALIAEKESKVIGYIVAVPDFNQVLKKIPNGKLFPFGILKILKYKKAINSSRVMLIGVDEKYRGTGLDLVLYKRITNALYKHNIFRCEASYIMSTNKTMNSLLVKIGGLPIKQYKLYKKPL